MQVRRSRNRRHLLVGRVSNEIVREQDLRGAHGRVGLDVAKLLSKRVVVLLGLLWDGVLGVLGRPRSLGHAVGGKASIGLLGLAMLANHARVLRYGNDRGGIQRRGDGGAGTEHVPGGVDVVDGGGAGGGSQRGGVGHNIVHDAAWGLVLVVSEVAEALVDRRRLGENVHCRLRSVALVRLVLWLLLHGGTRSGGRLMVVTGRLWLGRSRKVGGLRGCLHSLEAMETLEVRSSGRWAGSSPCLNKLGTQEMRTC